MYDVKCTAGCGYFEDVFALLADSDDLRCSECNHPVTLLISPVRTIGPTFSKPLEIKQIGRTFNSQSEFRAYQVANPDIEVLSPDGNAWQSHKDRAREKFESKARLRGYRDVAHMKKELKKDSKANSTQAT
jgi:hypothetical protein